MGILGEFLKRNAWQREIHLAERFADAPEPTFWSRWFGGILLPLILARYGWVCCESRRALFDHWPLQGNAAVAFGLVWISAGLFLHFHYFWSTLRHLGLLADPGKLLALLGFVGSGGYLAWCILTH